MRQVLVALASLAIGCAGVGRTTADMGTPSDAIMLYDFAHPPPVDLTVSDLTAASDLVTPTDLPCCVDQGVPDQAKPDLAQPDLAQPDLARPDLAKPDLAAAADLASPDLVANGDLSRPVLSFLGNTAAFQTGTASQVMLFGGTAPGNNSVSAITQTYPQGSAMALHLIYSVDDPSFANQVDLVMTFDKLAGNNDQWYAIIPAVGGGHLVYWYLRADGYAAVTLYDPGNFQNFTYTTN